MPIPVTMPRLSDTMEQGTVVRWNVREGQTVRPGDVIADIETDKATLELQSFDEGTVAQLVVPEGGTVPVGTVIMVLAAAGESVEWARQAVASAPRPPTPAPPQTRPQPSTHAAEPTPTGTREAIAAPAGVPDVSAPSRPDGTSRPPERIPASPLARKIAAEAGLDLASLVGTGPGGRITRRDVEAALARMPTGESPRHATPGAAARAPSVPPPTPPPRPRLTGQRVPLSNIRRVIARRLVESKTTIPHFQVTVDADVGALLDLRRQINQSLEHEGVHLSVNDFIIRACALALPRHPMINSRWIEQGDEAAIELVGEVNIGVAIALPAERGGGLVVGVLHHADQMTLRQISAESKRLAEKARTRGLTPAEMDGSTFTVSNLGMFAVEHFSAIIAPPNAAILAVGSAMEKPVVQEGRVVPAWRMAMTLSSDHRIIDGVAAAQFLGTVRQLLEHPAALLV